MRSRSFPVVLVLFSAAVTTTGQSSFGQQVEEAHQHDPIVLDARPIISRLEMPLVHPRRILLDGQGDLYVADSGAGAVLSYSLEGKTSVLVDGLDEPSGLAQDSAGTLYVSTFAGGISGAGAVFKLSSMGKPTVYVDGLSAPTAIAFDKHDNLYVAGFDQGTILRITTDGQASIFAADLVNPTALAFDKKGRLLVTSGTEGTVSRISPAGEVMVAARGLLGPADLVFDPQGRLIVVNLEGTELSHVDEKGRIKTFALVPKGTVSVVFTPEGNFILANWDLDFLLKVVSRLEVPCPHCDKKIPVELKPQRPRPKPEEPSGPVI